MSTRLGIAFHWKNSEEQYAIRLNDVAEKAGQKPNDWARDQIKKLLSNDGPEPAESTLTDEILLSLQELGTQITKQSAPDLKPHLDQILKHFAAIEQQQSQLQSQLATAFAVVLADGGKLNRELAKAWTDQHFK